MAALPTVVTILYFSSYLLLLLFIAIQVYVTEKHSDKKSFLKAIWSKKAIYGQILIHFYDTATDLGVLIQWYLLAQNEQNTVHIDMYSLVWATVSFLVLYRLLTAIMVLVAAYNNQLSITETIFDVFLSLIDMYVVKVVYKSIKTNKSEPTSKQKAIQLNESIFESLPQVILQTVFIVRSWNDTLNPSSLYLVSISLIASVFSVANKYVWLDKDSALFKARDPHWKPNKSCCKACCFSASSGESLSVHQIPKCTQHSSNDMKPIRRRWKAENDNNEQTNLVTHEQTYNEQDLEAIINTAITKAETKIKDAVKFLRSKGGRLATMEFIAYFLYSNQLDPEAVGEFISALETSALSESNHRELMSEYMKLIDLTGKTFIGSFRYFLTCGFRFPKEAQKTDRLIDGFSKVFVRDNPHVLDKSDQALVLSYAVLMLNTELHNEKVKKAVSESNGQSMDFEAFKGMLGDQQLDEEMLKDIFESIKNEPIALRSQKNVPLFSSMMTNVNIAVYSSTSVSSSCSCCYEQKAQYKCDICFYYLCSDCYDDNTYFHHQNECVRPWYLVRVLWRFCYVASRFIVLSLLWAVVGVTFFIIFVSASWIYWSMAFWFGMIQKAVDRKHRCLGYGVSMIYGAVSMISTPSTSSVYMAIFHGIEIGIALGVVTMFAYNGDIECNWCIDSSLRQASNNDFIFMFIVSGWSLFGMDLICYALLVKYKIFLRSASLTAFGTFADGLSEKIE
eukprot:179659_1